MRAYKMVYFCDHCGIAALEDRRYFFDCCWKGPPENWSKLGKEDLCPLCAEVYLKFKNEVKEKSNA